MINALGKWKRPKGAGTSSYRYQCSECGGIAYQVTGNCGRKIKVSNPECTYKFCPNCGIEMEVKSGRTGVLKEFIKER